MRWPFRRRQARPDGSGPGETAARPSGEWRELPAVGVLSSPQPTAGSLGFVRALPSRWQQPPALGPLGHDVTAQAPGGLVSGLARGVDLHVDPLAGPRRAARPPGEVVTARLAGGPPPVAHGWRAAPRPGPASPGGSPQPHRGLARPGGGTPPGPGAAEHRAVGGAAGRPRAAGVAGPARRCQAGRPGQAGAAGRDPGRAAGPGSAPAGGCRRRARCRCPGRRGRPDPGGTTGREHGGRAGYRCRPGGPGAAGPARRCGAIRSG